MEKSTPFYIILAINHTLSVVIIMANRTVALVGCGQVGMSYAYALLNSDICNELILIDVNEEKAKGEAMDLNHGLAFSPSHMRISAGSYSDCKRADLVVIAAGASQRKPGQTRLDLLQDNVVVFRAVVTQVVNSGFDGIFLVATNPVDIMTRITQELSGFPAQKVLGSGTTLDTARLRYLVGNYFGVDPRNIHGYVIGEHGESEFVATSQLYLATKSIEDVCKDSRFGYKTEEIEKIAHKVRNSAAQIIKSKGATCYGIGMALVRITKAIFGDENSVLTVSSKLNGEYGLYDVYLGLPAYVNASGVKRILALNLTDTEKEKLKQSYTILNEAYKQLKL